MQKDIQNIKDIQDSNTLSDRDRELYIMLNKKLTRPAPPRMIKDLTRNVFQYGLLEFDIHRGPQGGLYIVLPGNAKDARKAADAH